MLYVIMKDPDGRTVMREVRVIKETCSQFEIKEHGVYRTVLRKSALYTMVQEAYMFGTNRGRLRDAYKEYLDTKHKITYDSMMDALEQIAQSRMLMDQTEPLAVEYNLA